ncbi:hypothetical protein LCGC14_0451190 [marine sediment metagenome]|uniref:Uncharacterized protein n=1 Tax=marine sediment metagenome TaxID=412755 RepID=A0A0F9VRU0_9ZZZZ
MTISALLKELNDWMNRRWDIEAFPVPKPTLNRLIRIAEAAADVVEEAKVYGSGQISSGRIKVLARALRGDVGRSEGEGT